MANKQTGKTGEAAGEQATVRIHIDESSASVLYANFCRVSSTPEEVILDLAMNPNPYAAADQTIRIGSRVIMNHFTAKRLAGLLTSAVQRHEAIFGELEVDVRKRLKADADARAKAAELEKEAAKK